MTRVVLGTPYGGENLTGSDLRVWEERNDAGSTDNSLKFLAIAGRESGMKRCVLRCQNNAG